MSYFGENNFSESPGFEHSYDLIRKILIDSNFYTQSCNIKRGIGSIAVRLDYKPLEIIKD